MIEKLFDFERTVIYNKNNIRVTNNEFVQLKKPVSKATVFGNKMSHIVNFAIESEFYTVEDFLRNFPQYGERVRHLIFHAPKMTRLRHEINLGEYGEIVVQKFHKDLVIEYEFQDLVNFEIYENFLVDLEGRLRKHTRVSFNLDFPKKDYQFSNKVLTVKSLEDVPDPKLYALKWDGVKRKMRCLDGFLEIQATGMLPGDCFRRVGSLTREEEILLENHLWFVEQLGPRIFVVLGYNTQNANIFEEIGFLERVNTGVFWKNVSESYKIRLFSQTWKLSANDLTNPNDYPSDGIIVSTPSRHYKYKQILTVDLIYFKNQFLDESGIQHFSVVNVPGEVTLTEHSIYEFKIISSDTLEYVRSRPDRGFKPNTTKEIVALLQ